jgi:hypothetical protein
MGVARSIPIVIGAILLIGDTSVARLDARQCIAASPVGT